MVDISIVNGIINQLITGGHHLVGLMNDDECRLYRTSQNRDDQSTNIRIAFGGYHLVEAAIECSAKLVNRTPISLWFMVLS